MTRKATDQVTTIGIDIGKNNFHLIGLDGAGNIVLHRKLSRSQVIVRLANLPPCLIGMETCVGAHHLSRQLQGLGHDARLMPAQYVKPYLRGQKNDFRDAEVIAEAVQRPQMRFVPTKSVEQLDLQAMHRVRSRLVRHRTSVINQNRALLLERGIPVRQGVRQGAEAARRGRGHGGGPDVERTGDAVPSQVEIRRAGPRRLRRQDLPGGNAAQRRDTQGSSLADWGFQ